MSNFKTLYDIHAFSYLRYQKKLADFILDNNLKIVVETGSGCSSLHILKALEKNGGRLYSIDPQPFYGYEISHPQYELIKKKSVDAMSELYLKTGEWDLFLHDSDHDILCQTYELEMAYGCVRKGGYIACDDYEWNGHFAWRDFVDRTGENEQDIGDIKMIQKRDDYKIELGGVKDFSDQCLLSATFAESVWLAAGNKNTFEIVYPDRVR